MEQNYLKKAKVCPKCGELVGKQKSDNLKVIAVAGLVIALIGGLLPFVQNTDVELISDAYSFMNIDVPAMWYLYMLAIVVSLVLLAVKKDMFSIIPTAISGIIFIVSFVGMNFRGYESRKLYNLHSLTDLLSNGYEGSSYSVGCGVYVVIIGLILGIAGCFIDIMKYFKKDINVDSKYMTNSINRKVWSKIYYHRWFYVMFLPVLIMILLFNYWPMLGCRYAFTKYIIRSPYYVGLLHFNTMFTNDVFFWDAFRNTLLLSIVKLILNTGAAVIISLLLNEITNLAFKKTVQTIVYLPHFMSWVVASYFLDAFLNQDNGLINTMLRDGGHEPVQWYMKASVWPAILIFMYLWKSTGYNMVIYLSSISGIDTTLYEAAVMDGANKRSAGTIHLHCLA